MKTKTIVVIGCMVLFAYSCVPSLFPLYTQKDIVYDDRIVGNWDTGENARWIIVKKVFHPKASFLDPTWTEPDEDSDPVNFRYRLNVQEWQDGDTTEADFEMTLLELDGQMFVNFLPEDYETHHDFLTWHMVEVNGFSKIGIQDNQLSFQYFDPEYVEEMIEKNRIRISHVWLNDFLLLTAPTKDLQKFVIKYSDEKDALLEPDVFERI